MYKIMLLVRDSETKPLWTEYREDGTVFETDDIDALVAKVRELFDRYTRTQIRRRSGYELHTGYPVRLILTHNLPFCVKLWYTALGGGMYVGRYARFPEKAGINPGRV